MSRARACLAAITGLTLLAALAATACATRGQAFNQDMIPFIEDDVTTREEVRQWFGEPLTISSRTSGLETWRYFKEEEVRRDTGTLTKIGRSIASILGARVIFPPVDVEYKNMTRHELVLLFDPYGVVIEHGYERTEVPSKRVY